MIRIGRIEYANCTPIFHALHEMYPSNEWSYIHGVPVRLNEQLAAGDIDVCPSSSIEFALHPDRYLIIPDLSISSCGPVQSVMLFSTIPLENLDRSTVLLSSESATSVNLLKILLKLRYGYECSYRVTNRSPDAALQQAPSLLLIGDAALRAAGTAPAAPYVYDLGELWHTWTGTPFVFALWLVSRAAVERDESALLDLTRRLWSAKKHALENLERIAESSPDAAWIGPERLLAYWKNNISYDLTASHIKGLNCFFHFAAELGLIADAPDLVFLQVPS